MLKALPEFVERFGALALTVRYFRMSPSFSHFMKSEIHRALRQADLDVLFLFFLNQQVNSFLPDKERYFARHALMLAKEASSLTREKLPNDEAMWNRMRVGLRMPYPLDPDTPQQ